MSEKKKSAREISELVGQFCSADRFSVPHHFKFVGERLYFIERGDLKHLSHEHGPETTSLLRRVNTGTNAKQLTKAEELLLERRRNAGLRGITDYKVLSTGKILAESNTGSLFLINNADIEEFCPSTTVRLFQTLSPDETKLAFVSERNLFYYDVRAKADVQLTRVAHEHLRAGEADFNHQEEMERYSAFWWSPDSKHLLYLESDESKIPTFNIVELDGTLEVQKYPFVGAEISTMSLHVASLDNDTTTIVIHSLSPGLSSLFKFAYIARAGWSNDNTFVWLQLLSRDHMTFSLVAIDIKKEDGSFGEHRILYTETSDIWINAPTNVGKPLYQFSDGSFLISSEKSGFNLLYKLSIDGSQGLQQLTPDNLIVMPTLPRSPDISIQLSSDESVMYFEARSTERVLEKHRFKVSITDGPASAEQLTAPGFFCHESVLSNDGTKMVCVLSNKESAPAVHFKSFDGDHLKWTRSLKELREYPFAVVPPESFTIEVDDCVLHGNVYLPPGFHDHVEEGVDKPVYPALIHVYGGPHVQLIDNSYTQTWGYQAMKFHLLAAQGFVVSVMDGRGSYHRGLDFEGKIKSCMGTVEVQDQAKHALMLIERYRVDETRIAVNGVSYGGYMSLMLLAQFPEIFKVGICDSAVTSWEQYDSGYTERYMGTPESNPRGYKSGSVLNYITGFPNDHDRLFIRVGAMDENVHMVHSMQLCCELSKNNKPYNLQIYPDDRHGMSKPANRVHGLNALFHILLNKV